MAHFENILIHVLTFDNSPQLYGLIKKISINLNVKILVYEYYLVQGSESLYIKAKCGIILSEIYELNKYIIVTSNEELDNALTNITRGESIYIKNGTYTLSKSYNIPCINIIGEKENPPIIQVTEKYFITTDNELGTNIFENLQFRGTSGGINLSSAYASAEIRNCNWKNMVNQYNFTAIYIFNHNDDKHVLIEDCEFINNYTTGYGHYCTNIHCIAPNGAKNITVQNCIFNATRNNGISNIQTGNVYRVAVNHKAQWENRLTYASATNCYFCNNQYLHANDTIYGFTSNNNCP